MANSQLELVIGSAAFFTEVDGIQQQQRRLAGAAAVGLSEVNVIHNVTVMNAAFYRRSLLQRIGGFDERFPISADKDFWLRLVLAKPRHILLEQDVIHYRSHAGSLTFAGDQREKLSRHLLELAATRLAECPAGGPARAAYRRWHAWAVAYRAMLLISAGRLDEALAVARAGLALDAAWPWRAMTRLPAHWRDRAARRGDLRA
jgi:GT2 family glycosyltransferase